jgi:hypothetical protein
VASRLLSDVQATLAADGTGTLKTDAAVTWNKVTIAVAATASVSIVWTAAIGVGGAVAHKVGFGIGPSLVAGPFVLAPGEQLLLVITGGVANDTIAGTIFGVQGINPDALTADTIFGPTVGSVTSIAPQKSLGTVVAVTGAGTSKDFTLPPGTHALAIYVPPGTGAQRITQLQVYDALNTLTFGVGGLFDYGASGRTDNMLGAITYIPIDSADIAKITVIAIKGGAPSPNSPTTAYITAIFDTEAIAGLPPKLGQYASAYSTSVVVASDQTVPVQDVIDTGRAQVMLAWEEMAGTAAAESALTNFTLGTRAATALAAANNYAISAGKTLRIQSVTIYVKSTAAAAVLARFRIRQATVVANNSPVIFDVVLGLNSATFAVGEVAALTIPIPDGLEVVDDGQEQITFTWFTSVNTCTVGLSLTGYEYTKRI